MPKHERTLSAIFAEPVRANIRWSDLESLMAHLGAEITPGGGSMFGFALNGITTVLHRPHPGKEMPRSLVRRVRTFLEAAGEGPTA